MNNGWPSLISEISLPAVLRDSIKRLDPARMTILVIFSAEFLSSTEEEWQYAPNDSFLSIFLLDAG